MTLTEVFDSSCRHCHSVGYRVEYEREGGRWIKRTICCSCRRNL